MKRRERMPDDDQAERSPLSHPLWLTLPAATLLLFLFTLCSLLNLLLLDQLRAGDAHLSLLYTEQSKVLPVMIIIGIVLLALLWGLYVLHKVIEPPHQDQSDCDESDTW